MPRATSRASRAPERPPLETFASTPARPRYATTAPSQTSAAPPNACEPSSANSDPLEHCVDPEEGQQAEREREQELDPAWVDPAHPGEPEHADRHRYHAHVYADQRHQPVEVAVRLGRLRGHLDRLGDGPTGGREQRHLIRLALDPRVLDLHPALVQPAELGIVLGEGGEAVVHDRLPDLDGVRAVVAQVQLDLARAQHGAVHDHLLHRRPVAVEPGRVERHEQGNGEPEYGQRQQAAEPGRHADAPRSPLGARLHQSSTS